MPRKQMNIRLDSLTIETIKAIALKYGMSESQVITRAVMVLEQGLKITSYSSLPAPTLTLYDTPPSVPPI